MAKTEETTMEKLIREAIEAGDFDMSKLEGDPNDETLVRRTEGTDEENAEVEDPPVPPKPARSVTEY